MSARQRDWARRWTARLRDELGGKCAHCGTTEHLTFDCLTPINPDHHRKMEWSARISFYRRQLAALNLQLLCDSCNGRKGDEPQPF